MALVYNKEFDNTYNSPDGNFTIIFDDEKEEKSDLDSEDKEEDSNN